MEAARQKRAPAEGAELAGEFPLRLVETLREAFGERLVSVVLFGSHARGEARPESDVDIFLVVKGLPESPLDRIVEVRRPLAGRVRERVAFIAKTPEEVLAGVPSLYLDLALDGRVLYDKGFFRERQAALRRLIEQAGLRRVVRGGEYSWEWETPPRRGWRLDWGAHYRLRLAQGFLQEAEQDYGLRRWRSCVDKAQMSLQDAANAILALFGPLAKSYEPGTHLRNLIESGQLVGAGKETLEQLLETFETVGAEEHFLTHDGNEATYRDPWSLFGEAAARRALEAARRCASGAAQIFEEFPR